MAVQADRIAELQRRLGADSSNSSRPPSSDAPWDKTRAKKRSSRTRSGRNPGPRSVGASCLPARPLLDNLTHRDRAARVPLLVDLPQKPRQLDLGFLMGPCGLTEVPLLAGQRVHARVHDRSERAVRPVLDVPAGTAPATCHDGKHNPGPSQTHSQTER
jgi:hypothetical protein